MTATAIPPPRRSRWRVALAVLVFVAAALAWLSASAVTTLRSRNREIAALTARGAQTVVWSKDPAWYQQLTGMLGVRYPIRAQVGVFVRGMPLWDGGMAEIARVPGLSMLHFEGCPNVDDAALAPLAAARELRTLGLAGSAITDASLPLLAGMPKLEQIALSDTAVTEAGIDAFAHRGQYYHIDAQRTPASEALAGPMDVTAPARPGEPIRVAGRFRVREVVPYAPSVRVDVYQIVGGTRTRRLASWWLTADVRAVPLGGDEYHYECVIPTVDNLGRQPPHGLYEVEATVVDRRGFDVTYDIGRGTVTLPPAK
jgi:hypothetical protein